MVGVKTRLQLLTDMQLVRVICIRSAHSERLQSYAE